MSVSYASAAGSATKKELKQQKANSSSAVTAPASTKSSVLSSSESSASSTLVSTPAVMTNSDPTFGSTPEDSTNQDINKESSKSTAPFSESIDRFKSGLTPAPVPTTNPWATTTHHTSSSSSVVNIEPKASQKAGQSKSSLDSVNWPKPDEGTLTEGSTLDPPTITKTRPGKEKWIPISYTPVSTKPRGGKHRGGKTNNGSNRPASTGSNGQANTNGNNSRRGSKAQGSHSHVQVKKTDGKNPTKARSSSGSAINSDGHNKLASEPNGPHTAPVVSSKDDLTKIVGSSSSSTKDEAGASRENNPNNGHHSKHYYSNPHNFNNRNTKPHNGKVYNRRSSHYSNGNFNGMQYYRNDYDNNFPFYAPVGPIDLFRPIIFQIEYYFSSTNLCKDTYLRGLMNSNGWVPLSLLSSFYRVSRLTNGDYNLFVEACKWAPSVEVVGDKIRLRQNWENWVFPYAERLEAGKNEDSPLPVNLVFNPAESAPFIPQTEVKAGNNNNSSSSRGGKGKKSGVESDSKNQ